MTNDEILEKQQSIIREILNDKNLIINLETQASDIDDWDSFTHIQIIAKTEELFKVKFALGELQRLQNVGDMVNLLKLKLS